MAQRIFGWCGSILKIDLSTSTVVELKTMKYAHRFLGGRGIATKIYWDEVKATCAAFDPANCLIFMTGPLCATGTQGASRFVVAGKSPMTVPERFCYGNLGGYFGPFLKKAGYDGIIITGRAERPSYVLIEGQSVDIRDAAFLWGENAYRVQDILREKHGEGMHFVTTGVAGENLCRASTLVTDQEGSATGGFGAVMGAKNLKAIVVAGSGRPAVARPRELARLNRLALHLHIDRSDLGKISMPALYEHQVERRRKASCYQCGLGCMRNIFRLTSGEEVVRKCQSLAFYMPWVEKQKHEPMNTVIDAAAICNDYSLCTMEIQKIICWLEECHRSGYLTERETGLELSAIGSRAFMEQLVERIARRQGMGNILAEGLIRAGAHLGKEAKACFAEDIVDVGEIFHAPREYPITSLLYALEPRQPLSMVNEIGYMVGYWLVNRFLPDKSPLTTDVFKAAAERFWGSKEAWNLADYEGKARATLKIQNRSCANESLVMCCVAWPMMFSFNTPDYVGDSAFESKLFSAATGADTSEDELHLYGERIFNLQRAILLREGWKPPADDEPAAFNFTAPVETSELNPVLMIPGPDDHAISIRGNTLNRNKFEKMRADYYVLRGWDPVTGRQEPETLRRLNLLEVVDSPRHKELSAECMNNNDILKR